MKKILLIAVCAMTSLLSMARDYTDQLVVTVNESETTQQTTVTVEELEDNYINFVLRNFVLGAGEDEMFVGNIEVNNLFLQDRGSYQSFTYNANLQIKPGNRTDVSEEDWVGPLLGNVPLVLNGKLAGDKVFVSIDIDMKSLEQIISVRFGTDFTGETTVTGTKEYKNTLTCLGTSFDTDYFGSKVEFDAVSDFVTTVQTLSNGDLNLQFAEISPAIGEEVLPLGRLTFNNVQTISRGDYVDFYASTNVAFEGEGFELAGIPMPMTIAGKYDGEHLYYTLHVDASTLLFAAFDLTFGTDFVPSTVLGTPSVYEDKLVVTVNDATTAPIDANVVVEKLSNGGINFLLKNFVMELEGDQMFVGNITLHDLPLYEGPGYQYFNYTGAITIPVGDLPEVDEADWMGPLLGEIPLRLRGRLNDEQLQVSIDIDMESLDQIIYVTFGSEVNPRYTVNFVVDDEVIDSQIVEKGGSITAPEPPYKEGYTFMGWQGLPETATSNVTIVGNYTVNTYNVIYRDGDKVIATIPVVYDEAMPEAPEYTPESDDRYTRTLIGWDGETYDTMPAHDVVYTAIIDTVDGVNSILADEKGDIYDLQGRRVRQAVRGLYIIGGKKVLVK